MDQKFELMVVSDIHLRGPDDQRYMILCELIESLAASTISHFVLLGDVFDFFFGMKAYYTKKYRRLGNALQNLAASGTAVYFYEGNHEFDLRNTNWPNINFCTEGDIALTLSDGKRVLLNHGDLIYHNASYRRFRAFVKSAFVKWAAWLLPSRLLEAYALHHAKSSRAMDPFRTLDHAGLLQSVEAWLSGNRADIGIIGHFHVPYHEVLGDQRLLSVNAWDSINFLAYRNGEFVRGFYRGSWLIEPAPITNYAKD